MQQIRVAISNEDRERIDELARRWGCSRAEAVRWAVWLASSGGHSQQAQPLVTLHALSRAMQASPHGLPAEQHAQHDEFD